MPGTRGARRKRAAERKGQDVFEGFTTSTVRTGEASVFVRYGGEGPPVLLLHGHPRTSATWHRVAPLLVRRGFTVVCPDLRGYGRSRGPAPAPEHVPHSKRAVAGEMVEVMRALGHERFGLAGHDRGAAVALRLVLDHPSAVTRVAFLDGLPVSEHLARADARFATAWWHWFSSPSPTSPSASSTPTPTPGTAGIPRPWGRRTTTSGGPPPGTRTSSAPCWRTTVPGSPWTAATRRRTGVAAHGSPARPSAVVASGRPGGPVRRPARHLARLGR
ncbi:alpha/beta fold hydrolase [Streptomyces zhihengii]